MELYRSMSRQEKFDLMVSTGLLNSDGTVAEPYTALFEDEDDQ